MKAFIKHFGRYFCLAAFFVVMLAPSVCHGHLPVVHKQITQSAFDSSSSLQLFLTENLGSVNYPLTAFAPEIGVSGQSFPVGWLKMKTKTCQSSLLTQAGFLARFGPMPRKFRLEYEGKEKVSVPKGVSS